MVSVAVGLLLAGIYSYSLHQGFFSPSQKTSGISQAVVVLKTLLRLVLITSVFFILLKVSVLDISVVLLSFITAITGYLFFVARKAAAPARKTGGVQSQRGV